MQELTYYALKFINFAEDVNIFEFICIALVRFGPFETIHTVQTTMQQGLHCHLVSGIHGPKPYDPWEIRDHSGIRPRTEPGPKQIQIFGPFRNERPADQMVRLVSCSLRLRLLAVPKTSKLSNGRIYQFVKSNDLNNPISKFSNDIILIIIWRSSKLIHYSSSIDPLISCPLYCEQILTSFF